MGTVDDQAQEVCNTVCFLFPLPQALHRRFARERRPHHSIDVQMTPMAATTLSMDESAMDAQQKSWARRSTNTLIMRALDQA